MTARVAEVVPHLGAGSGNQFVEGPFENPRLPGLGEPLSGPPGPDLRGGPVPAWRGGRFAVKQTVCVFIVFPPRTRGGGLGGGSPPTRPGGLVGGNPPK